MLYYSHARRGGAQREPPRGKIKGIAPVIVTSIEGGGICQVEKEKKSAKPLAKVEKMCYPLQCRAARLTYGAALAKTRPGPRSSVPCPGGASRKRNRFPVIVMETIDRHDYIRYVNV